MSNNKDSHTTHRPDIKKTHGISPLWILPVVTLLLAGWMVFKAIHDAGERIRIYFPDAQGLVAGRTPIRYQGLEVGMVKEVKLAKETNNIYVEADLYPEATYLLSTETRFWLVKPKASISGISGLDALVSGNYITIQPSNSTQPLEMQTVFNGLKSAPSDIGKSQGLNITLEAEDLGGISIGSAIVYKKIPIGEVYSYELKQDAKSVEIHATIHDEYRQIITDKSRFWNVSGISAQVDMKGIDVQFESLTALIAGSIAVDSPDDGKAVESNKEFKLFNDLKSAGRGVLITLQLPENHNISGSGSSIMYRGIEIGQIINIALGKGRKNIMASAAIQPAFIDLLNSGTQFVLEEAEVSLSGVHNVANLVTGNFLTIKPGHGAPTRDFSVVRKVEFNSEQNSLTTTLVADQTYGISKGSKIRYRGIAIGEVTDVILKGQQVAFTVQINRKYQHLVRSTNRFYVLSAASVKFGANGVDLALPAAQDLLAGSIGFISSGKERVNDQYQLFASQSLAELAQQAASGAKNIVLHADNLPSISKGTPLLYRNLPVGQVIDYSLDMQGVSIKATIGNQYRHLINDETVFWNQSGVSVDASLSGIKVTASPVSSLLQGGISFDTIKGTANKINNQWKLYDSYTQARAYGKLIRFTSAQTFDIAIGTPINYQSIQVGEISSVTPNFTDKTIDFQARIKPEYADIIARQGTHFWVPKASFSLKGMSNIKSLLIQSIAVEPGSGAVQNQFTLTQKPYKTSGLELRLQGQERGSVSVGTPILYRGLDVGRVTNIALGELADRVIFTIEIDRDYTYLVRQNSLFWNASGVNVSIGLTGADIKAGSLDSLISGGIAFTTPDDKALQPPAESKHSFFLHTEVEDKWLKWNLPIAKPLQ
jgi:paraquat-inducible protein B